MLAALLLLAGALPALAKPSVDPAIRHRLGNISSVERERGMYALLRFYDPTIRDDRDLLDRAVFSGTSVERAAMLRGLCDRRPAGGTLDRAGTDRVLEGLESLDVAMRSAAIECLDRLPPAKAAALRVEQLGKVEGSGLPPVITRAVLTSVIRHPDRKAAEVLARVARTELRGGSQFTELTPDGAWLVMALAANGTPVEPFFSDTLKDAAKSNYVLQTRLDGIRAAHGEEAALAALIETANVAVDRFLRREAVDYLLVLPAASRAKAMTAIESRLGDVDGQVRARLVRELSREAANADIATEKMIVRALGDVFPDLRVQAVAGLFDRAAAGTLAADALAAATIAAAAEKDSLVAAAYRALFAKAAQMAPLPATPTSSPSPSPSSSPSPSPSPSPTPRSAPAP